MLKAITEVQNCLRDTSGAAFMVTGLMLTSIMGAAGLGLDVGVWYLTKRAIQSGADAAALAAAHQMTDPNSTNGDVVAVALVGAEKNGFSAAAGDAVQVTILPNDQGIQVVISRTANTYFTTLLLSEPPIVSAGATAASRTGTMELALVLDVSGSMNKPEKIGAAKSAAQDMIDILYGDEETLPNTWVAVIPFSGRVNIRDYGGFWVQNPGSGNADKLCVGLRSTTHWANDAPPDAELFPDYVEPKKSTCPHAKALGLTAEKSTVKNHIAGLTTTHGTSTHRGMVWGWRALSPDWRAEWGEIDLPLPYDSPVPKVAVIMTDGRNKPGQSNDPYSEAEANALLLQECNEMKALDITIFTVVFAVNDDALFQLYSDCATPGRAFVAEDAAALFATFSEIGGALKSVRLIQ